MQHPWISRLPNGGVAPVQTGTFGGEALTTLSHATAVTLPARIRARAAAGAVSSLTDLAVVSDEDEPGSLDLALAMSPIENDGIGQTRVSALVTRPDGTDADDGTRVLFHTTRGIPSAAFALTTGGIAEIALISSAEPGEFAVHARVAGSVVHGGVRGAFAARGPADRDVRVHPRGRNRIDRSPGRCPDGRDSGTRYRRWGPGRDGPGGGRWNRSGGLRARE